MTYLAVPYSHPDRAVREERFRSANRQAAKMMAGGQHVFSPISHTHPIAEAGDLPLGWEYWETYDRAILQMCSELVVLMVPGWDQSKGVRGEVAIAESMGIPVRFIQPDA